MKKLHEPIVYSTSILLYKYDKDNIIYQTTEKYILNKMQEIMEDMAKYIEEFDHDVKYLNHKTYKSQLEPVVEILNTEYDTPVNDVSMYIRLNKMYRLERIEQQLLFAA